MRFFTAAAIASVSFAQSGPQQDPVGARLNFIAACPEISTRCAVPSAPTALPEEISQSHDCVLKIDLASVPPGPCRAALAAMVGRYNQVPFAQVSPEMIQQMVNAAGFTLVTRNDPMRTTRQPMDRWAGPPNQQFLSQRGDNDDDDDDEPRSRHHRDEKRRGPEIYRENNGTSTDRANHTKSWHGKGENYRSANSESEEQFKKHHGKRDGKDRKHDRKGKDDDRKGKNDERKSKDDDRKFKSRDGKSDEFGSRRQFEGKMSGKSGKSGVQSWDRYNFDPNVRIFVDKARIINKRESPVPKPVATMLLRFPSRPRFTRQNRTEQELSIGDNVSEELAISVPEPVNAAPQPEVASNFPNFAVPSPSLVNIEIAPSN